MERLAFQAPPLSCDCHAHIVGPAEKYPYSPARSFTPHDALEQDYRAMLDPLGIERMVITQPTVYGADHTRLLDAIETLGRERTRGVAMVGAEVGAAALRALDERGVRATRFITTAKGGPALEELETVARNVAPLGWHVEIYVPSEVWPDLLPVVDRLPVPVVFDHMGAMTAGRGADDPVLSQILRRLDTGKHWVKLCAQRASLAGPPYADVAPLARLLIAHAPEHCVWGTDWPHTNVPPPAPDDAALFGQIANWTSDPAVRRKILVENPGVLYRFP